MLWTCLILLKCDFLEAYKWAKLDLPYHPEVPIMWQRRKTGGILSVTWPVPLRNNLFLLSILNSSVCVGINWASVLLAAGETILGISTFYENFFLLELPFILKVHIKITLYISNKYALSSHNLYVFCFDYIICAEFLFESFHLFGLDKGLIYRHAGFIWKLLGEKIQNHVIQIVLH